MLVLLVFLLANPPFLSTEVLQRAELAGTSKSAFISRNVTVKEVSWYGRRGEMLPLQIYSGEAVPPKPKPNYSTTPLDERNLSRSARNLLQNWEQMGEEEKNRLENKIQAESKASEPLDPDDLKILYLDADMCVTVKKSGILSVPGPRKNPSLAGLVHSWIQPGIDVDKMVVHRLDMDTSGIIAYALNECALRQLHNDFRDRRVKKTYEALLAGHVRGSLEFDIDVSLERDPFHPPFMRVSQTKNTTQLNAIHPTFQKFIDQAPKPSQTEVHVLSFEHLPSGLPVTRVRLIPLTGRTHQLRVHCASLGHPIVGDDIYGYNGAGDCGIHFEGPATEKRLEIQRKIYEEGHCLCLHAKQLCLLHPVTRAPIIFESVTPF